MSGAIPVLDQSAEELGLVWSVGDDLNFSWYVRAVDWSGAYTATVYDRPGGRPLLTFPVTATFDVPSGNTLFSMSAVDSTAVRSNGHWRLVDDTLNITRLQGPTSVTL